MLQSPLPCCCLSVIGGPQCNLCFGHSSPPHTATSGADTEHHYRLPCSSFLTGAVFATVAFLELMMSPLSVLGANKSLLISQGKFATRHFFQRRRIPSHQKPLQWNGFPFLCADEISSRFPCIGCQPCFLSANKSSPQIYTCVFSWTVHIKIIIRLFKLNVAFEFQW